jgi:hypothetical protein
VRLAREPTSDDSRECTAFVKNAISGDPSNVSEVGDAGESVGKDGRGIGIDFGEGDGTESGKVEGEGEPPITRE